MGSVTQKQNRRNDGPPPISLTQRFLEGDVADRYLGELGRELVKASTATDPRVKLDALRLIETQPRTVQGLFSCEASR